MYKRQGGPVGAFALGVTGATFGDYIKDEIKFNLKKDVDKSCIKI